MTLGDRLLVLHQGRPAQLATPMEVFDYPADTYVASFIGAPAMNFLPAVLTDSGAVAKLAAGPALRFVDGRREGPDGKRTHDRRAAGTYQNRSRWRDAQDRSDRTCLVRKPWSSAVWPHRVRRLWSSGSPVRRRKERF